ncbi:hypothetical protein NJB93_12280 [Brucella intermedia]|uniref:hypothetical protein n=1 Tax=Brucella intermedia TaxID=94625 RepID=UPI00209AAC93|nr:hypothetical protein [Brucella intermedia]MCO7727371.1 hypothetical protein [Brucella intermedia]
MADERKYSPNYHWALPLPQGNQIIEIKRIGDTITAIDEDFKAFVDAYNAHKHKFRDIEELPTTLEGYGITDAMTTEQVGNAISESGNTLSQSFAQALSSLSDTITKALGLRVRVDEAQEFSLAQKKRARDNIEAVGAVDKGAAGGVAPLGADGKVASTYLPALTTTATVGAAMAGANGKTTPDDGDFFGGVLAGGSTMFKTTWANIKAALAAIFVSKAGDTLTGSLGGVSVSGGRSSFWGNAEGGGYAQMWTRGAPFYSSVSLSGSSYAPVIAEKYGNPGWGGIWSAGVLNYSNGAAAGFAIHHLNSSGNENVAFEFRSDGTARFPGAVYRGGSPAAYADGQTYWMHITGNAGYAASAGNANSVGGWDINGIVNHINDRAYWRTQEYLLAEAIPVGGYGLFQSVANILTGNTVAGTSLRWASAAGAPNAGGGGAVNYGTWQNVGVTVSGSQANNQPSSTTLWKRIG